MPKISFAKLDSKIKLLGSEIIGAVKKSILEKVGEGDLNDYKVVWKQLQDIAGDAIKAILEKNFEGATITIPESKSAYPDVKMEYQGHKIAFDVKSNESSKDPWYDIARLDTIELKRLAKFNEEYDLVVKYDSKTKKLLEIYFEPLRCTVGYNGKCKGVKFRPYDGKLRPKSWADFENKKVYWKTKEAFAKAVKNSKMFRRKNLIKQWIKDMTAIETNQLKGLFD